MMTEVRIVLSTLCSLVSVVDMNNTCLLLNRGVFTH